MKEQSYQNHSRYIPMFHFITGGAVIAVVIGSIVNLITSSKDNLYSASLVFVISLILASLFWYAREFVVRVQDRAIRAEENFRHFILTGKPLDSALRMAQIIALRFAPDEEFIALAQEAAVRKLNGSEIKKKIKTWRADHHRA